MKDIFPEIEQWVNQNKRFAIATVVNTWRSSPRPIGSSLIVSEDSEMVGSVSGGCVEKSVVQKALKNMKDRTSEIVKYGVKNEDAWEVGLSCGGKIDVLIEPFLTFDQRDNEVWETFQQAISNNIGAVLITELNSELNHTGIYLEDESNLNLDDNLLEQAKKALKEGKSGVVYHEEKEFFAHVFPSKNRMLIIGSAHITTELIQLANMYDFETIIIDPRNTFATKTQYTVEPDQLLVNWPQEVMTEMKLDDHTFAVILSHDPKIDDEALAILLNNQVSYIGALGSKRTHEKRVGRLKERGFTDDQISRIHAPIGVDINAQIPNEIALSVMAEVIKAKNTNP